MKKVYFTTKKNINTLLKMYGGYRKYTLNETYTQDKKYDVVFTNKFDKNLWLRMRKRDDGMVEVTLTNEKGIITQRDVFEINSNSFEKVA